MNANGLWKQTRKIFPKNQNPLPIALEDKKGNLMTGHEAIKSIALSAIVERLRKRPMQPHLQSLEKAKTKRTKLRLRIATRRKSPPWAMASMDKAIRSMKSNKCRDPEGLINELLKP